MGSRRELSRFDATMVVVGGIIGAGIFINPYIVAQSSAGGTPSPDVIRACSAHPAIRSFRNSSSSSRW